MSNIIVNQPNNIVIQSGKIELDILRPGSYIITEPGKKSSYTNSNTIKTILNYLWLFICYPLNFILFGIIFISQLFSPQCINVCGNKWCYNPSQNIYIHSLFIIRNNIVGWNRNTLLGISERIPILIFTNNIPSPPLFIFNEKSDKPELLSFDRYLNEIDNIPKFSGKYRSIDGGGNRKKYTFLGQGGRGYSQTEPYQVVQIQPNVDIIVDKLYKRVEFKKAINGTNSLATWFANIAIHDLFRSANNIKKYNMNKPWVNLNSSYLDLQVLYGYNNDIMNKTRSFKDGKLIDFAEERFNRIPECRAILEIFRREHNFICDKLKEIYPMNFNQDEIIYQQARLIMGGVFINIIFRDYLGCIMFSENASNGKPFIEFRQKYPGTQNGNHNSLNFNILYQWHSTIPLEWDFKNQPDIDNDEQLKVLFSNMLNWNSGAHKPKNTPELLSNASKSLIKIARECGAPRLNDFRRRTLTPYKDFMDMCGDKEIANILSEIYPSIEDVELVVGVQVEKSSRVGWGLPKTVEQSIISDAFCTVYNDRFYTDDFNPKVYTDWGYKHSKETNLADLLNRHLNMNIDRNIELEKIKGWKPEDWV